MIATYLATPTATDPMVRDNIHPTAFFYRRIGEWIGKAILRAFRPKLTPAFFDAAFPSGAYSWFANGWTSSEATYSLDQNGRITFEAVLTAGTVADGTTVMTLPAAYRPNGNRFIVVSTDAGSAVLQCQADGACKIYGMGSATFMRINGGFYTKRAMI